MASRFTSHGSVRVKEKSDALWFTVTYSQPHNFGYKSAADGLFRLPLQIDMTLSLDAPGFCVMLGDSGQVQFCSDWDSGSR